MNRSEWRTRAACLSVDPELFFPTADKGHAYLEQVAAAKAVCARCPVRSECLDEAVKRIPYGIAGGLTPEERRHGGAREPLNPTAALEVGLRPGARRVEVEAAGRVLLARGVTPSEVSRRCGVSERTVARWIARWQTESAMTAGEGSAAATAAPLRISQNTPLQGKRAMEGTRV